MAEDKPEAIPLPLSPPLPTEELPSNDPPAAATTTAHDENTSAVQGDSVDHAVNGYVEEEEDEEPEIQEDTKDVLVNEEPSTSHEDSDTVAAVQADRPLPAVIAELQEGATSPELPLPPPPEIISPASSAHSGDIYVPNELPIPEKQDIHTRKSHPMSPSSLRPESPSASMHRRTRTMGKGTNAVSVVLVSSALEAIAASKEAKRSQSLKDTTQRALELIRGNVGGDNPREIYEPLRLACETRNEKLMIVSLDCISKLISYGFFAETSDPSEQSRSPPPSPNTSIHNDPNASQPDIESPSLVDLVVHTITSCHSETTPETVSLQIVKALLALVLSPTVVHHSSLLKAVRTVYNVFLLSNDPVNRMVAQGGLTQMVHHIFTRCKISKVSDSLLFPDPQTPSKESFSIPVPHTAPPTTNGHSYSDATPPTASSSSLPDTSTPPDGQLPKFIDDALQNPRQSLESTENLDNGHGSDGFGPHTPSENDMFIKDAFLVFRALCKLTMKPLNNESERDLKSHPMRSKLLSLHLVLTILNSHMALFVDPSALIYSSSSNDTTTFVQAVNQYLCLCLSRNAVSPVPEVFELSVEIFWRVLAGMRTKLKKEIEVLLHEIFIPILEMRTSTLKQKAVILAMLSRLCQDPQALVEIYLNYDCDSQAADNIYEHLMNIITKIGSTAVSVNNQKANDPASPAVQPATRSNSNHGPSAMSLSAMSVSGSADTSSLGLSEMQLKRQGLECLVAVLRSLVAWGTAAGRTSQDNNAVVNPGTRSQTGEDIRRDSIVAESLSSERLSMATASVENFRQPTPEVTDDPTRFESAKQKKTTLLEGIKKFNFKPKRGIKFLIENGFIANSSPQEVAAFLLKTDGLNKAMIGEYLGEGDESNIAIMHAFVDSLDFKNLPFVEALRVFLQSFRLPGEAQKIDRFMLKFAERYIEGNTQTPFANADTAYVLAYSVILLNTDAHNPQVKKRMTKQDFIKNNRGINDNSDLPEDILSSIYDDIVANEIRMKDEVETGALTPSGPSLASALANVGRDLQKEAYVMQTSGMANKTEALFRTMLRTQRTRSRDTIQFFSASHFVHVRPMFEVAWIPFLAGLSGPLQETDDLEVVELCLDGFKSAIRIVCFFDLELQRNAFVTTLSKFTFLNNLGEMKTKNMEAIKALLDVAVTEGNNLKSSWHEVLTCVSQLERMQLISAGADVDSGKKGRPSKLPTEDLANESRSTHITVAVDMVFSLSHFLSGTAIVDFVQALSDVSWEEIQSSGLSQHPRLFSLQKLVEISYYNMNRIRLEWSNLWDILGEHFNQVCCHNNPHVCFFALDSLRQLAMRFLEKEELSHFKFQKDFLKPFEYTMVHNHNPESRDMVLQCMQQMIQARVHNLRSGWRTMFGVFQAASKVLTERIANSAFEIVTRLNKDHFGSIVRNGAFADLTVCITDFCKVSKYQKISLLAIGMLRGVIPIMLASPECGWSDETMEDNMIKYWYPVLFGFYDIIMNGEDLEVRRLALDSLFTTLKTYGRQYPTSFWDTVCQELLFPIFAVLKSSQDLSRFNTQEDMSVWLSTTMIQALRDLIDLYTFYFDILERLLNGLLDLLCVCICQENDTLARIGTSCLQQLLEQNVAKLSDERWEHVATTFVKLFKTTTPHELFHESLRAEIESQDPDIGDTEPNGQAILPAPLSSPQPRGDPKFSATDRRRVFKQIIVKCVLQLLLIETTNDLLRNDEVYATIPPEQLLRLMAVLDHSYQFARMFNDNKELRTGLWKVGFMKHLPNLLKQESSSAATLVHVLLQMYYDERPDHQSARPQIADRLLPLGLGVLQDYNKLRPDTQGKNIIAWTPVVAEILDGFCQFEDRTFKRYLSAIYPLVTDLLSREVAPEIRQCVKTYFMRVGYAEGIIEVSA